MIIINIIVAVKKEKISKRFEQMSKIAQVENFRNPR